MAKFLESMYGIWNLDFFRTYNTGICLQTDNLTILFLDLTVAVYPLLLMALIYMMIGLRDSNYKLFVILGNPFRVFFVLTRETGTSGHPLLLFCYISLLGKCEVSQHVL